MYLYTDSIPDFDALDAELKAATIALLSRITPTHRSLLVEAEKVRHLSSDPEQLVVVTEGAVCVRTPTSRLFCYESGDILLVPRGELTLENELAIRVDIFPISALMSSPELAKGWIQLLASCLYRMMQAYRSAMREASDVVPRTRTYARGSVIVEQDETGGEVFTLLQGEAEVRVDGVAVGVILQDEIFGALAGLTKGRRNASVIATTDCLALVLPENEFIQLIRTRPDLVHKVVRDMARTISDLNQRVVDAS